MKGRDITYAQLARTIDALLAIIDAGATRVGATAAAAMLDEFARR
jgi:hypothetical protein